MLQALEEVLRRRRSEGWSVGGTVRDRLLGRASPDIDVAVMDDAAAVARETADMLGASWFALSARHGAYRVVGDDGRIDIARIRGNGILDDLALRDFTINAMAQPLGLSDGATIDPHSGRRHLADRVLVPVSDHIFADDPLRLMRAVRFSHVLGMEMDPSLRRLLDAEAGMIVKAAPERVVAELAGILEPLGAGSAVDLLSESGLLRAFLPEAGDEPLAAPLQSLDSVLESLPDGDRAWARRLCSRLAEPVDGTFSRSAALRMALLLRATPSRSVAKAAIRLKLSRTMASLLLEVSGWYGRTAESGASAREGLVSAARDKRSVTEFLWETAPWEPEVVMIAAADAVAGDRSALPERLGEGSHVDALLQRWEVRSAGLAAPPFDGAILMEALGLGPGPRLGRVLREALLAWESGEIDDRDGAVKVAATELTRLDDLDDEDLS